MDLTIIRNIIDYLLSIFILIVSINLTTKFSISDNLRNIYFVILGFISLAELILSKVLTNNIMYIALGVSVVMIVTPLSIVYILFKYDKNSNDSNSNIKDKFYLFMKSNTYCIDLLIIFISTAIGIFIYGLFYAKYILE